MKRFEEIAALMQDISFDIHMTLMGEGASHTQISEEFDKLRDYYKAEVNFSKIYEED